VADRGRTPGNPLRLGATADGAEILLTPEQRGRHLYVVGSTGSGKSKLLEGLIRQDIINWRDSRSGVLVLDPHGKLYDDLMRWLAETGHILDRPIIPIDLRRDDWIIAYNLLRERKGVAGSVVVENLVSALTYVWGGADTDATPRLERNAATVFTALYERKLTVSEALHLLRQGNNALRMAVAESLSDETARFNLELLAELKPSDFHLETASTLNRFQRFLRNDYLRTTLGQSHVSLDFGRVITEGASVIVSLATAGGNVSRENARTFATLILADLWIAALERGKADGLIPFYPYVDEFQRFVTPTMAESLDEARGYGIHFTFAHQFPSQLLHQGGEHGRRLYESVMENTKNKVVFSLSTKEDNLTPLAHWLYGGTFDPYLVKRALKSRKVLDYREEMRVSESGSTTHGWRIGVDRGAMSSHSDTVATPEDGGRPLRTLGDVVGASEKTSEDESFSATAGFTTAPILVPVMGEEISAVHDLSTGDQLLLAEQRIMCQPERHATARLVGMRAPVEFRTPEITPVAATDARVAEYRVEQLEKWPFALPFSEAKQLLAEREASFVQPDTLAAEPEDLYPARRIPDSGVEPESEGLDLPHHEPSADRDGSDWCG